MLSVMEAGPSSTVQDRGRFGFLRYGVSTAGPCDMRLHAIANRLVGNGIETPTIEFTLKGDRYKLLADSARIAVVGDVVLEIDGERVPSWRSHTLRNGQVLSVGYVTKGIRGYLAVAGGYDLLPELGSCSVHVRSGVGPLGGVIKDGMTIPLKLGSAPSMPEKAFLAASLPDPSGEIRVVLGPQDRYFSPEDISSFLEAVFQLTPKCDRMGSQLNGPKIEYRSDLPLISEGIALGSIQVLSDGVFIVALLDRQTVGGYPKIATVISADIPQLTQASAVSSIRFRAVEVAEARAAWRQYADSIQDIESNLRSFDSAPSSEALLSENLISGVYF